MIENEQRPKCHAAVTLQSNVTIQVHEQQEQSAAGADQAAEAEAHQVNATSTRHLSGTSSAIMVFRKIHHASCGLCHGGHNHRRMPKSN
mmetsp:Transcript_86809/g.172335  ORF Transcript_86809/g.172335 Transcript_86809/m.172335 type:complete len:89 (-) Transcript_86809:50-316(-)